MNSAYIGAIQTVMWASPHPMHFLKKLSSPTNFSPSVSSVRRIPSPKLTFVWCQSGSLWPHYPLSTGTVLRQCKDHREKKLWPSTVKWLCAGEFNTASVVVANEATCLIDCLLIITPNNWHNEKQTDHSLFKTINFCNLSREEERERKLSSILIIDWFVDGDESLNDEPVNDEPVI